MGIIIFLLIGAFAGWLASQIMKDSSYGLVGNIIIGCVGALIGGFIFKIIGVFAGLLGSIVTATVGAVLLFLLIGAAKKNKIL